MDAGNMLKPMLARGELHCIGATTLDEYRKYIEKDAALERRFQPVLVDEPTVEDTISILRGLKERFEVHHGVRSQDAALVAARRAVRPLHHRPVPARQGHRPDGRGRGHDPHGDRLHAGGAGRDQRGRSCSWRSSDEALKKEKDAASKERLADAARRSSPSCRKSSRRAEGAVGAREGEPSTSVQRHREKIEADAPRDRAGRARLRPRTGGQAASTASCPELREAAGRAEKRARADRAPTRCCTRR